MFEWFAHPPAFRTASLLYFGVAVVLVLARRQHWPNLRVLALLCKPD
jgi:hypothetical protein